MSLVRNGQYSLVEETEEAGYHLRIPMIDIVSIGAGGGMPRLDRLGRPLEGWTRKRRWLIRVLHVLAPATNPLLLMPTSCWVISIRTFSWVGRSTSMPTDRDGQSKTASQNRLGIETVEAASGNRSRCQREHDPRDKTDHHRARARRSRFQSHSRRGRRSASRRPPFSRIGDAVRSYSGLPRRAFGVRTGGG